MLPSVHQSYASQKASTAQPVTLPSLRLGTSGVQKPSSRLPPAIPVSGSQTARQGLASGRKPPFLQARGVAPPLSARLFDASSTQSFGFRQGLLPPATATGLKKTDSESVFSYSPSASFRSWAPGPLMHTLQDWNAPLASLRQADLRRNSVLRLQMEKLRLNDYFDVHGGLHFERLGLSFAAKQNAQVASSFGSRGDIQADSLEMPEAPLATQPMPFSAEGGMVFKARSYLAAQEARARDAGQQKSRAEELIERVNSTGEHLKVGAVQERQLGLLFEEVPSYQLLLPVGVRVEDMLPPDLGDEQELEEKAVIASQNGQLLDRNWSDGSQMFWLFNRTEVLRLSASLDCWGKATRGSNQPMGMDRPTFCRFLMDCNLLVEGKVPFHWAVALFDSVAQPMRCCPQHVYWAATAPLLPCVSNWRIISVMDAIGRQLYDHATRAAFLESVTLAEKKALPPAVQQVVDTPAERSDDEEMAPAEEQEESSSEKKAARRASRKSSSKDLEAFKQTAEIEGNTRMRLLSAMLVEPEVLHLVIRYQELFRLMHEAYVEEESQEAGALGHMEFPELLRFCTDFRLTPNFVTEDSLRRLYDSVLCFDAVPVPVTPRRPTVVGRVNTKMMLVGDVSRSKIQKSPSKSRETSPSKSVSSHPRRTVSSKPQASPPKRSRTVSNVSSNDGKEKVAETQRRHTTDCPTRDPEAPSLSPEPPWRGVFGPSAFIEILCKVAFMHLGYYGNRLQQSSSSYFRTVWLITYLAHTCLHMHESQERRLGCGSPRSQSSRAEPKEPVTGPVADLLQTVPMSYWQHPPQASGITALEPRSAFLQPLPGRGLRKGPTRKGALLSQMPRFMPGRHSKEEAKKNYLSRRRTSAADAAKNVAKAASIINALRENYSKARTLSAKEKAALKEQDEGSSSSGEEVYTGTATQPAPRRKVHLEKRASRWEDVRNKVLKKPKLPETGEKLPDDQLLPLEDLFGPEGGKLAIVDDECTLCGRYLTSTEDGAEEMGSSGLEAATQLCMGDPHCRGCSHIDVLNLEQHPFARIIFGPEPGKHIIPPIAKRHVGSKLRAAFSPPPTLKQEGLKTSNFVVTEPIRTKRDSGFDLRLCRHG
ncbi:unnamed protein product [Polarella glacialis]|uniref:Uncharacterized protein n=1 Tax=Polarella glacialis TaxID=89957 RepID=A0A813G417_POLGL|nr:unnamed protein product [Polarella glacialis]